MKERPVLFSTEMVRAILDGRKTMTRRVLKGFPQQNPSWEFRRIHEYAFSKLGTQAYFQDIESGDGVYGVKCPYGQIGDVLWVREAFCYDFDYDDEGDKIIHKSDVCYKASGSEPFEGKWRPSIFMPRSASRISLRITNIRVEQLNDITEEDAKSEGVTLRQGIDPANPNFTHAWRFAFCKLWESINGKGSWEKNPWVWVIEFEVMK